MKKLLLMAFFIFLVSSCAYVISKPVREQARTDVPFAEIKENIEKYKGTTFILGGVIVETKNTDGGSVIEAVETPIDSFGNLIDKDKSSGRFLAVNKGILDPLIYKKGREITIAGELTGSRKKKIGEAEYVFPVFEIKELYLWKDYRGYYYPPYYGPYYSPYYYTYPYWWYEPWWYGPMYP